MRCKVKSNSLGYNGHIYREGEYVDVISSEELERLLSYDVIAIGMLPITVAPSAEVEKEKEVTKTVKTPVTSVIKGQKGGKTNECNINRKL